MPAYVIDNAEGVWPRPFEQCRIFVCFRRLDFDPPFSGQRFDQLLWSPALVGLPFRVLFMTMMDRLHRGAFTFANKRMDAVLWNTASTEKEREEAAATKEVIGKELSKEYMKGFARDTYIDGHRKTTWKENSPGHLRHHKQQGRRHSLLAEIERSRYRIPSERTHKALRVQEAVKGQTNKGITGIQEFRIIAKKLGLQLHLYSTLGALEEAVLIKIKGADTLYISRE